jgi:hypothetical protein
MASRRVLAKRAIGTRPARWLLLHVGLPGRYSAAFVEFMNDDWPGGRCQYCGVERPCVSSGSTCADPCLGVLPGVRYACCGHGVRSTAYVRFENGATIRGFTIDTDDDQ